MAIAERLSELEKDMAALAPRVDRLDEELFNHSGMPGLKTLVVKHIAHVETLEEERDKALKRDSDAVRDALTEHNRRADSKVNIVIAICAVVALFLGVPAALFAVVEVRREILHNELTLPTIVRPNAHGELYHAHINPPSQFAGGRLNPDQKVR